MAKANPSYYQTTAPVSAPVQYQEHLFHLFVHQQLEATNGANQLITVNTKLPHGFGLTVATDWDIRDGPDTTAKVVARAQGLHQGSGKSSAAWFMSFNTVFTDERFKGSSLSVQGHLVSDEGEWVVTGGTGEFAYAQGVVTYKKIKELVGGNIRELHFRVVCFNFPKQNTLTKVGPWGGSGGTPFEIPEADLPQRLESVTIQCNEVIDSIAFTYVVQLGARRTVGPFGGGGGIKQPILQLGPSETVKEIFGTTGNFQGLNVVTSLSLVTNVKTYGPFGKQSTGNTPFRTAAPDKHSIVGFYGRAGQFVDQLGAYVRPTPN
ncbi:mannose/glucose-specific lectin-like [Hordeum vulgare]|nr:mannose/glucose-specific lectin-like [Hordeum vulgare]